MHWLKLLSPPRSGPASGTCVLASYLPGPKLRSQITMSITALPPRQCYPAIAELTDQAINVRKTMPTDDKKTNPASKNGDVEKKRLL
jgi:hypothetical protein